MTKQLRQALLSVPLTPYPLSHEERARLKAAGSSPAPASAAPAAKPGAANEVKRTTQQLKETEQSRVVLQRLQAVFAALQLSQRSTINQLPLKSLLTKPYCEDKQHDSREYGSYLLSQMEDGLRDTPLASLTKNVFGGKIKTVSRCQECG
jgi:hypothetical protein